MKRKASAPLFKPDVMDQAAWLPPGYAEKRAAGFPGRTAGRPLGPFLMKSVYRRGLKKKRV